MTKLYYIELSYAAGGIETDSWGKIVEAPPIWKHWIGKNIYEFIHVHWGRSELRQYVGPIQ